MTGEQNTTSGHTLKIPVFLYQLYGYDVTEKRGKICLYVLPRTTQAKAFSMETPHTYPVPLPAVPLCVVLFENHKHTNTQIQIHDGKWFSSALRSGKPGRASESFERAVDIVRGVKTTGGNDGGSPPPLALARCLFHAGEARRQNGELGVANTFLEEAAVIVATETSAGV